MENVVTINPMHSAAPAGFKVRVEGGAQAARSARKQLSRLRSDLDPPTVENIRLLVTELVTNAVRHANASWVEIAVLVGRDRVRCEVFNFGEGFDIEPAPQAGTPGGWGLFLVDRLSSDWGVIDTELGAQRVWFELTR